MNTTTPADAEKKDASELEKAIPHILLDLIKYKDSSVVTKSILKKATGMLSLMSFDSGEGLSEKISPFDMFAQIIEGTANIIIDRKSYILKTGQGIIIPAHLPNSIKPNGRFKMLLTVIKSGYEM